MGRSFSSLKPVDYDKPEGCKECSRPTDYDEFSSAVDFTVGGIASEYQGGEDDEAHMTNDDAKDYQLDNDVSSNLNVLGQLFSDMTSIKPNKPSALDDDGEEEGDSRAEGSSSQVSRPGWGVTGLMQRYDPNDSKSAKFEVKVSTSKTTREESKTAGKEESKVESSDLGAGSEDEVESDKSNTNASSSSEDSEDEVEDDEDDKGEVAGEGDKNEILATDKTEADREKLHTEENADDKKEIYEQDKLEGIFQEARSGEASDGFQMSQ